MASNRLNKKQDILQAATLLFAEQGFDATTTVQISKEAGITEPMIYYHFDGKNELFTEIIAAIFEKFYAHLERLPKYTSTEFEKIENLIALHFDVVEKMPDEIYLALSACPARLQDPNGICRKSIQEIRQRIKDYLARCLEAGMATGEFHTVDVDATANLIGTLLTGMTRQRGLKFKEVKGIRETTVEFCRRSLVKDST